MNLPSLLAIPIAFAPLLAAGQEQAIPPARTALTLTNLSVRQITPTLLEIGLVRLDQQQRTVTVPAFVNQREGPVEYVLVTSGGKTHESLLRTDAQPLHIHVAMLLLGATGARTNDLPPDPAQTLPGDPVTITVHWKKGAGAKSLPAGELVLDRKRRAALAKGPWTYTGSRLRDDGFAAQFDGSIISLITDPDALINNPRPGREDDDNWLGQGKKLPAFNQPVEVVITLAPAKPGSGR